MTVHTQHTADDGVLAVAAWRDHDPAVGELPGMSLGDLTVPGGPVTAAARALFDVGARRVALRGTVDLTDTADAARSVHTLSLIGALTGRAVAVDWQVRTPPARPDAWIALSHLHPPTALHGPPDAEEALRQWRHNHYLCKCVHRQGPGFVQVRDRRHRRLRRFTIDAPDYLAAIRTLADGAPARAVPSAVLADLLHEELAVRFGDHIWWAPYAVRRWPLAAMVI